MEARGKDVGNGTCGTCCGTDGNALKRSSSNSSGDTVDAVLVEDAEDCESHETGLVGCESFVVTGEVMGGRMGRCWVLLRLWWLGLGKVLARLVVVGVGPCLRGEPLSAKAGKEKRLI